MRNELLPGGGWLLTCLGSLSRASKRVISVAVDMLLITMTYWERTGSGLNITGPSIALITGHSLAQLSLSASVCLYGWGSIAQYSDMSALGSYGQSR